MRGHNNNSRLAWLLPLIVVRALVPIGFMPAWQDGALRMVLCEPYVASHAGTPAHHHHGAHEGAPAHHHQGECPFAQSAGPALSPAVAPLATAYHVATLAPSAVTSVAERRIPLRYQSPRGPPAPPIAAI